MALYIEVPKDLNEIKQKLAVGLTKRQLVCFGIAAAVGGLTFWATYKQIGITNASYCLFAVVVFIGFFGIYNPNGITIEEKIKMVYRYKKGSPLKTYQSENIYNTIENALEYRRLYRTIKEYERRTK